MEIERKYLIKNLPFSLNEYSFHKIEQAYLNTDPVIRIRKQDDDYIFTYKGRGLMVREEYNLPLMNRLTVILEKKPTALFYPKPAILFLLKLIPSN